MTTELILALVAMVATPVTGWLTAKTARSKYAAELDRMRAEVKQMQSDVRSRELDNDKKAINMIMELVVEPLRRDMKLLQDKLDLFTYAIERIPTCPHSMDCPVEYELRRAKESGVGPTHGTSQRTGAEGIGGAPPEGQHCHTGAAPSASMAHCAAADS